MRPAPISAAQSARRTVRGVLPDSTTRIVGQGTDPLGAAVCNRMPVVVPGAGQEGSRECPATFKSGWSDDQALPRDH